MHIEFPEFFKLYLIFIKFNNKSFGSTNLKVSSFSLAIKVKSNEVLSDLGMKLTFEDEYFF